MSQSLSEQEVPGASASGRTASRPAARPRRRSALLLTVQIVFGLGLVAVVAQGLYWATVQPQTSHDQAAPVPVVQSQPVASGVPAQLGRYRLVESMTGAQAVAEINQLHGTGVGVERGYIAHYDAGGTAWVAFARDENDARRLLDLMVQRIGRGNAYFKDLKELTVDGQAAYTVVGQGQRHYFYRRATAVVWLAAPAGGEEAFLRAALAAITSGLTR